MVFMYKAEMEVDTKYNSGIDITQKIRDVASKAVVKNGICHIFLLGTTAGLMLNEYDKFLAEDFKRFFSMFDEKSHYNHPDNAFSHLRANLLSAEKTVPLVDGKLVLGEWQSLLLWEFDIKPRKRKLIVTIVGEEPKKKDDDDEEEEDEEEEY